MSTPDFEKIMGRIAQATGINSQIELASILNLNRSAISRAKKRGKMPERWISRLCDIFDLDPKWLKKGQNSLEDLVEVPLAKAKLDAGGGSYIVDSNVRGHVGFGREYLSKKGNPGSMVLMEVIGDSMEPVICEGDSVLIDQSQLDIYSGAIYALGLLETIMVKRLEKHPDKLLLLSENSNYTMIALQGDELDALRIIGRVVGMWRDFR